MVGREEVMRSDGRSGRAAAAKSDDSQVGCYVVDGSRIAYIRSIWAYKPGRVPLR